MPYLVKKDHGDGKPKQVRAASSVREALQEASRLGANLFSKSFPPDTRVTIEFDTGEVIVIDPADAPDLREELGVTEETEAMDASELVVEINDQNPPEPPEPVTMP